METDTTKAPEPAGPDFSQERHLTAAEAVEAIRKTQDGKSYFSGSFGPGWIKGKLITPED